MGLAAQLQVARHQMASVLFLDLVRFSPEPIEEQTRLVACVQHVVQRHLHLASPPEKELICISTGDGLVIVVLNDFETAAQLALVLSRAFHAYPDLKLRMGINVGPVNTVQDITGKTNVIGDGINLAQRVMDCGDAGHILLSHAAADMLRSLAVFRKHIVDLGPCPVKHGSLQLFNLWEFRVLSG